VWCNVLREPARIWTAIEPRNGPEVSDILAGVQGRSAGSTAVSRTQAGSFATSLRFVAQTLCEDDRRGGSVDGVALDRLATQLGQVREPPDVAQVNAGE
jgi:hypothetical protein